MSWTTILSSKRFWLGIVTAGAGIVLHYTGAELPVDDIVNLVLTAMGGLLAGYVAKEARVTE